MYNSVPHWRNIFYFSSLSLITAMVLGRNTAIVRIAWENTHIVWYHSNGKMISFVISFLCISASNDSQCNHDAII